MICVSDNRRERGREESKRRRGSVEEKGEKPPRGEKECRAAPPLPRLTMRGTPYLRLYRVTHHIGSNLPLKSKQKFHFGLACPDLARPKRKFCLDVNGRFEPM